MPEVIEWKGNLPKGNMKLLKGNKRVKYVLKGDKVEVTLPKGIENEPIAFIVCFKEIMDYGKKEEVIVGSASPVRYVMHRTGYGTAMAL